MLGLDAVQRHVRNAHAGLLTIAEPGVWIGGIRTGIAVWLRRSRSRHDLAMLDEHLLRDVGLSRSDQIRETEKPFWQ